MPLGAGSAPAGNGSEGSESRFSAFGADLGPRAQLAPGLLFALHIALRRWERRHDGNCEPVCLDALDLGGKTGSDGVEVDSPLPEGECDASDRRSAEPDSAADHTACERLPGSRTSGDGARERDRQGGREPVGRADASGPATVGFVGGTCGGEPGSSEPGGSDAPRCCPASDPAPDGGDGADSG